MEWLCTACGSRHDALIAGDADFRLLRHVRPLGIHFDRSRLNDLPRAITEAIEEMSRGGYGGLERRQTDRFRMMQVVLAIPYAADFQPAGDQFVTITRDISRSGLSLVATRAVHAKYLATELISTGGDVMGVVMRIVRCCTFRRFYEVAGELVTRIGS